MIQTHNKFYFLRWRFDFHGSASRFGMWSDPGNQLVHGAWKQTRIGLSVARAIIEGKDFLSRQISVLADVPGQDFVMFEWNATAVINPFGGSPKNHRINGLSIVARDRVVTVGIDGKVTVKPLPNSHKTIQFSTYGK